MNAYYNEHDPYAAQWLRNLIDAGHIAPGDVDTRSIEDVCPDDLKPYTQCHFFAGVGVWSAGLRRIGWPDDRPIWTGSCPCQPFSAAGKGGGFDDERHLWPAFFHLITARRPKRVVGEQVASKDGLAWFDLVQADLEGANYAGGAVDLCAAGVGAPHWRQRLWWVASDMLSASGVGLADTASFRRLGRGPGEEGHEPGTIERSSRLCAADGVGNTECVGAGGNAGTGAEPQKGPTLRPECHDAGPSGAICVVDDAAAARCVGPQPDAEGDSWNETRLRVPGDRRGLSLLANAGSPGQRTPSEQRGESGPQPRAPSDAGPPSGALGGMAVADDAQRGPDAADGHVVNRQETGWIQSPGDPEIHRRALRPGPVNGFWRDADWLFCRDGKWRPARPGSFPLVNGASARMGRLRAYGNAICVEATVEFLMAVDETVRLGHD